MKDYFVKKDNRLFHIEHSIFVSLISILIMLFNTVKFGANFIESYL